MFHPIAVAIHAEALLRADTSAVKDRIKSLKDAAFPGKIQFSACGNTKEGMEKKEG